MAIVWKPSIERYFKSRERTRERGPLSARDIEPTHVSKQCHVIMKGLLIVFLSLDERLRGERNRTGAWKVSSGNNSHRPMNAPPEAV